MMVCARARNQEYYCCYKHIKGKKHFCSREILYCVKKTMMNIQFQHRWRNLVSSSSLLIFKTNISHSFLFLENIIERIIQYIKDRTDNLMSICGAKE